MPTLPGAWTQRLPSAAPRVERDSLGILSDAASRAPETLALAARHLDQSLVDVLGILGFDRDYVSAKGSYLYDADGRAYLDMHTGEGFASLGHNHPGVREVLQATLASDLVDGVQIHYSVLAGMLAEELSQRLPRGLDAVYFASGGAEAVDSAMKFARAATGRHRFVSCDSSFHGVTLGPLSLVGDDFFKEGFGPLLPGCARVPFGDLDRLEAALRKRDVAAFIVEPIQGRMVTMPPPGYLQAAQELCRRYGTLFVVDEIQTGLGRTGRWFALEDSGPARPALPDPRARLRAGRQGAQRRLHAGRRDGHDPRDLPARGRHPRALLRPPVDLRPQPPGDGGRSRGDPDHRARSAPRERRSRGRRCCAMVWASFATATRWSATSAAPG